MAENWQIIAVEIAAALEKVGMGAILLRQGQATGPDYDPEIGPDSEHPVTLMQDEIALGLVDGETLLASDIRVMIAPAVSDRLRLKGVVYSIQRAQPFAPAGVAVYYDVILRV